MAVLSLGGCERCGGDTSKESDIYGSYEDCLQCGSTVYLKTRSRLNEQTNKPREVPELDEFMDILRVLVPDGEYGREYYIHQFTELPTETIMGHLDLLENHGYIRRFSGLRYKGESNTHAIIAKGTEVFGAYTKAIQRFEDYVEFEWNGNGNPLSKYSLVDIVDEHGELTTFGKYAIEASEKLFPEVLSKFLQDIYQITIESSEVPEESLEKLLVGALNS